MHPPKTPLTSLKVAGDPVYTLEQLHEFAHDSVQYELESCLRLVQEIMQRCETRENLMGYVIAEEIYNKISLRGDDNDEL